MNAIWFCIWDFTSFRVTQVKTPEALLLHTLPLVCQKVPSANQTLTLSCRERRRRELNVYCWHRHSHVEDLEPQTCGGLAKPFPLGELERHSKAFLWDQVLCWQYMRSMSSIALSPCRCLQPEDFCFYRVAKTAPCPELCAVNHAPLFICCLV